MKRFFLLIFASVVSACGASASAAESSSAVTFSNDVMAVLSKPGCNAGACHGNKNGKGSFKLSLRGQDPALDYEALTRDLFGRRVNTFEPDNSLILLKPTGKIAHEGGLRFEYDSLPYRILQRWIAQGAPRDAAGTPTLVRLEVTPAEQVLISPADRLQIKAIAVFSDGSRRDVSDLAVYEQSVELAKISPDGLVKRQRSGETTVLVRFLQAQEIVHISFVPARPGFVWTPAPVKNYVDTHIQAKLKTLRTNPSAPCTDTQFVRRAYLDLLGILPTPTEAQAFIADASPEKRARLIDSLLERPEYADFWAMKWSDLLRSEERALDRKGVQAFHRWIRQSLAENKPLDQFVRELITARGSTYANPPANFYRANRDAVTRGEATAQVFLGIRLQCAQCHNHPFDRWSQDDYYGWADVFARVDYKVLENRRTDKNDNHEFIGEQIVYEKSDGEVKDPRPGKTSKPRLLGSGSFVEAGHERLDALGDWITSPENPFFAKAQVNRIWFHLMGRGLVDPVDDFRATNPPSHPALLDALAADFVAHRYDVRYLIRLIMNSQAYSLSSQPNETNADDETNYSHVLPRRLTAEQLLDAQHDVAGVPTVFTGYPVGMRATQLPGVRAIRERFAKPSPADQFLVTFGKPARLLVCECERSADTTLGQTFQLVDGPELLGMLSSPSNRLGKLIEQGKTDEQIIEALYWCALSRGPAAAETQAMTQHIKNSNDRRKALEDVLWALLNAKEFVLRQ